MPVADRTHFGHLLAVLDDVLNDQSLPRGRDSSMDERERAAIEHLRSSSEAQVTLLLLAWEMKAEAIDDDEVLRDELETFAATIRDWFDVDLLRTAAANLAYLPADFPTHLLPNSTTNRGS